MRSELNEIHLIDQYLLRRLDEESAGSFEARILADHDLAEKVEAQRLVYRLVRRYARTAALARVESIRRQLMAETAFVHEIENIFA